MADDDLPWQWATFAARPSLVADDSAFLPRMEAVDPLPPCGSAQRCEVRQREGRARKDYNRELWSARRATGSSRTCGSDRVSDVASAGELITGTTPPSNTGGKFTTPSTLNEVPNALK